MNTLFVFVAVAIATASAGNLLGGAGFGYAAAPIAAPIAHAPVATSYSSVNTVHPSPVAVAAPVLKAAHVAYAAPAIAAPVSYAAPALAAHSYAAPAFAGHGYAAPALAGHGYGYGAAGYSAGSLFGAPALRAGSVW